MGSVTLQHAWSWECPDCGERNTTRNEVAPVTEDDIREGMGLDPWESIPAEMAMSGEWYCSPSTVMCASCAAVHDAIDPADEGED